MKKQICLILVFIFCASAVLNAQQGWNCVQAGKLTIVPARESEDHAHVMSHAYWEKWNEAEQARIDADIEKYRKADAVFKTGHVKKGTTVKVEQVKSEFVFGCSAFNWNQLGSSEMNEKYRNLFGTLFNRATVPFYWNVFEPNPGNMRFQGRVNDTEAYWNKVHNADRQPNWRRPSTDDMVQWLNDHDVAVHGHPLVWGNRKWHFPSWLQYEDVPQVERRGLDTLQVFTFAGESKGLPKSMTAQQIADLFPVYLEQLEKKTYEHIDTLMRHYGDRIQSWDVVNESATDYALGVQDPSLPMCRSHYGFMFTDYTFRSMKRAEGNNLSGALLNVNDYVVDERFVEQAKDLIQRGAKVDVFGSQMHLFEPQQCLDIAEGLDINEKITNRKYKLVEPKTVRPFFESLAQTGVPTCLSEITITSAGEDERGEMIQAIISRNLYRLWFSLPSMMGITWWNAVDNCGAAGEPSMSGLFHRDMTEKPVLGVLDQLINHEWKTNLELKPNSKGQIKFRGFKGTYRITWTDPQGKEHTESYSLR